MSKRQSDLGRTGALVRMSLAPAPPETSSTSLSRDPNSRNAREEGLKESTISLSLEHSSTTSGPIRQTDTVPENVSAGNTVVTDNGDSWMRQSFNMLRASATLRSRWGSNFDSILDEHERISAEVDELKRNSAMIQP